MNPSTMLPREVHAKAEMKVELKCRARAYLLFREATERMLALISGRPLSSSLNDGTGEIHASMVKNYKKIENFVSQCDWWIENKIKKQKIFTEQCKKIKSKFQITKNIDHNDKKKIKKTSPSINAASLTVRNTTSAKTNKKKENKNKEETAMEKYTYPKVSIHSALSQLYVLMKEMVVMENCASVLQRKYRGHRGYLMFRAMKSIQVIARVTKEYMYENDPYRDKVQEYVQKQRQKEFQEWMLHSVQEYRTNVSRAKC